MNSRTISLDNGKLIFIDPSESLDLRTLSFLAEELHEEIQLASVFDTILETNIAISSNLNLKTLLHRVMSLSEEVLNCEVSSVMLLSPDKKKLYWEISRGDKAKYFTEKIILPIGKGISGNVAKTGESILVNDVSKDARWCRSYDDESGFCTRSMMCVPVKFFGEILGVINVINKITGEFTSSDLLTLEIIGAQTGGAIANARIHGELEEAYEDLKVLDKAKERVINHLSHELKTPLAILSGVLQRLSKLLQKANIPGTEKTIHRGQRNLCRLLDLQEKIEDILTEKSIEEKDRIISIIEDAVNFVEEVRETSHGQGAEFLALVIKRIESLFLVEKFHKEPILIDDFLHNICDKAISVIPERDLRIIRTFEKNIILEMDRFILEKVFEGLLKNAIENTPDEGKIQIIAESRDREIKVCFHDYGVGITLQNQKMIFGGFFHTQETKLYSSKSPYEFNAGGSGSDLLRIKAFSERYGFAIAFDSTRCKFLPNDTDSCPGRISDCKSITTKSECFASGGSSFCIKFPREQGIIRKPSRGA